MNTITAADFTVEFDVTDEMWQNFNDKEYKEKAEYSNMSPARAFKRELKFDIEKVLTESL